MSANELENLMSQLHVQSELNIDTKSLGTLPGMPNAAGYKWAYAGEQTHYRNGAERLKPLPDNYVPRVYENAAPPYVPTLLPGLVDLDGKSLLVKKIPKRSDGHIDTAAIKDPELWKAMYFNEFYNRKGLGRKYYKAQARLGRAPPAPEVPLELKKYPSMVTHVVKRTPQSNPNPPIATTKKTYPSMVTHQVRR